MFQPEPFGAQPEQIFPVPALYQLRRQQEIQHAEQAEPEGSFQMHADHGQPAGRAAAAQTEREQALLACLAVEPLELLHWQIEAARRAQATPGETGQQLWPQQAGEGSQAFSKVWCFTEQCFGQDVQRQALVQGFEPPEQQQRQTWVLPQQQTDQAEKRQRHGRPGRHQQLRVAPGEQGAEVQRLPWTARADRDAGITQLHAAPSRQTRSKRTRSARAARRRCT